jgi:hypothetical protein
MGQVGLSSDLDHSFAAVLGSTSLVPYLCQAMSAMLVNTLVVVCGRSPTMTSSNEENPLILVVLHSNAPPSGRALTVAGRIRDDLPVRRSSCRPKSCALPVEDDRDRLMVTRSVIA